MSLLGIPLRMVRFLFRNIWWLLAFAVVGVAGAGAGYVVRDMDIVDRTLAWYERREINRSLGTEATFEAPWTRLATHLEVLEMARIPLLPIDNPGATLFYGGSAIEEIDDGLVLFVSGTGRFGTVDIDSGRVNLLDAVLPMNTAGLKDSNFAKAPNFDLTRFRALDLVWRPDGGGRGHLYASHHRYEDECIRLVISRQPLAVVDRGVTISDDGWETVFEVDPCLRVYDGAPRAFSGHQSGGRIVFQDDRTLLFSIGDFEFDGVYAPWEAPQDPDSDLGRLWAIDTETGSATQVAMGLRNPQGLVIAEDGTIWETEHGPAGGDELNIIRPGGNYGWPVVTYGKTYSGGQWPLNPEPGRHDGFAEPVFSFVPSIAPSGLMQVTSPEFSRWSGDLLIPTLRNKSILRVHTQAERVVYVEQIDLGYRLREAKQLSNGWIAVLQDAGFLILLRNADGSGEDTSIAVSGLSEMWGTVRAELARASFSGDKEREPGLAVFQAKCASCHLLTPTLDVGPHLVNVLGREIGAVDGFEYSAALGGASGAWTEDSLLAYIQNPVGQYPGTNMPSVDLTAAEAQQLVDYLKLR